MGKELTSPSGYSQAVHRGPPQVILAFSSSCHCLVLAPGSQLGWMGGNGAGKGERGKRDEHTVRKAKRYLQVSQPKQRVRLRATAWLLLPEPNRLRHSAPGPRERPSQSQGATCRASTGVRGHPMPWASAHPSLVIWKEGSIGHQEAWNLFLRSCVTDNSRTSLRFSFLLYRGWLR